MEKIHKFKKEVLTLNIYSMINYYPGNPYYIGKDRDERLKKNVEKSNYKEFISEKNQSLYKELITTDSILHYYVGLIDDTTLSEIYDEVVFSIARYSLVDLKTALDILESYNYDVFFEELNLLGQKFLNAETTKEDEHRFKAVFKNHFGYSIHLSGKITTLFVGSLKREMKKRVESLEALVEITGKVIAIKEANEASAFSATIGLQSTPKDEPKIKSLIESNIERSQVKSLFEFIDFLYLNRAELMEYNSLVGEYEQLKIERESMPLSNNYKSLQLQQEIDDKIEAKKEVINTNITEPVKFKAKYLGIYDAQQSGSDGKLNMSGINRQKENYTADALKLIQLYEKRYVEFRQATNYNEYDCNNLFEGLDNILEDLFSFFSENGESKLKLSKDKHLESIRASSIKPLSSVDMQSVSNKTKPKTGVSTVVVAKTANVGNTKIPSQTKTLFDFIDFLHSNIENFNQYDTVFKDIDAAQEKISTLGSHYTEMRLKKKLEERIKTKVGEIFDHIIDPIKDKVAELDVFDWNKPLTLLNNHHHAIYELSKNCDDDDDLEEILNAKKQYIDFKINTNYTHVSPTIFRYLNNIMKVITVDFFEEGDKKLPENEVRKIDVKEEAVKKIKSGKTTSYLSPISRSTTADLQSALILPNSNTELSLEMSDEKIKARVQLQKVSNYLQETFDKSENPELEKNEGEKPSAFIDIPDHSLKEIKSKGVEEVKNAKERVINSENLSVFFKSHFKEEKPINYLCRLVEELKTDRTDKEFGEIALMIHNSEHINDRVPKVFNKWLIIFSNCIDIKKPSYKKGKLNNPSHNLRQLFNYL